MNKAAISLDLEKVTEDHAEMLYSHLSDPILYEYLEDEIPTLSDLKHKFKFAALEKSPDNDTMTWLKWAAVLPQRQFVGVVEIGIFDDAYAEIGLMTFANFQKRGYAPAYCSKAIALARERFDFPALYASVNEQNYGCRKVLENLDFELYSVNKTAEFVKGKFSDELIYRLTFLKPN
ncbi:MULTISPECIES: GNAT family N-acetyltransferase [Nostocales]|uniref:Acetyltransferase n=3 Tax=Nostocales TaxID=1161 RepID=A0A0C1R3T0_9CYAN|nr:GNAT family N-acetyltransferase [Tolypothrix bouteillei]KAF3889647.1 GNAT family N-acetyltransferase [Tolypothrix bouteillei VB521301]